MKFDKQFIKDLIVIKPDIYHDNRGKFNRHFCKEEFLNEGINFTVCQGNLSENFKKHTIRGFHFQQQPYKEAKIISPISGKLFNVVIDLRPGSPTFLKHFDIILSAVDKISLHVPAGCANAFLTLEQDTIIHYYMSDFFNENKYSGFRYNDKFFDIDWPAQPEEISQRDLDYKDFNPDILVK